MKIIPFVIIVVALLSMTSRDTVKIPEEAIRLRVVANSDTKADQDVKMQVKNNLETTLYHKLIDIKDISTAKKTIEKKLPEINSVIETTLKKENYTYGYNVNFGSNYFPSKEFKGIEYKAGNYDSLVVTLGSGEGNNWWCVLFPPLCLLEAEETVKDDVEYQFFVKKIIDKYLK